MTTPDFKEWANTVKLSRFPDALQHALNEAFTQGRSLGKKEQECLWWEEQDLAARTTGIPSLEGNDPDGVEFSIPSCLGNTLNRFIKTK